MSLLRRNIAVIVPAVVVHNLDPHTGIPFLPHMAAHLSGAIDSAGHNIQVLDCFSLDPNSRRLFGKFMVLGIDEELVVRKLDDDIVIAFIYCRTIEDLFSVERIAITLKRKRPSVKVCLFENIQTTNSFSLRVIIDYLFNCGCDAAIMGEPERRVNAVINALISGEGFSKIFNIAYKSDGKLHTTPEGKFEKDLDALPLPLWEKFPMDGYWSAGFSHAPVSRKTRFLPILSSRGCPYRCKFCVAPTLNPEWRGRTAENVVDEMEYFFRKMAVTDFHFSDLDPTVNDKRTRAICQELIRRKLPITWKIAQGTKIETIKSIETLRLMKQAGCAYFSFSPESGSPELMKKLNKPFDHDYGLKIVRELNNLKIYTQACFIAGCPGETPDDREQSVNYVKKLVLAGVDEIAVFIYSPLPGSYFSDQFKGFTHYSELTRSPTWRSDYKSIKAYRRRMYLVFLASKLRHHPGKIPREFIRIVTQNFGTKMEMAIVKLIRFHLLKWAPYFFRRLDIS